MKITTLVAALGLTFAPALAMAQSSTTSNDDDAAAATEGQEGTVTEGGTSQGALPILGAGAIPAGATVVGGVVIVAGVAVGIAAATDNDSAVATTTSTQ